MISHNNRKSFLLLAALAFTFGIASCSSKTQGASPVPNRAPDLANLKSADGVVAHVTQGPDLDNKLVEARDLTNVHNAEFVVSGTRSFDGWFLKADRIVFESGATLRFSRTALSTRRQFWIVAKEIVVKDAEHPGVITWDKGIVPASPPSPGEAGSGPNGPGNEGADAGPGKNGDKGAPGAAGEPAPQITVVVMKVPSSGPLVDLTGGPGGTGGQGMKGGQGGVGATGITASQGGFDCRRGAGNGGRGGNGGAGGPGGEGGAGGAGGILQLLSSPDLLPSLTQKFRILNAGGPGGQPGLPGVGGNPGDGGQGGSQQLPWCRGDGGHGPGGTPGPAGGAGAPGGTGQAGDFTVGGLSADQFKGYIWPGGN